ncbi:MAG TPA: ATP-binding protein [Anaerolineales bacterium]|nr:ATP-binding protein [Anaerolineales bacterium]
MIKENRELSVEKLRRVCDPSIFDFQSTAELPVLNKIIGQERAVRATTFGIDIESPGYHIFALGPAGTGKTTMIRGLLERKSADQPVPDDLCYVNNFEDSDKPRVLRLPAGMGSKLERDMDRFVEKLSNEVPSAFETKDYEKEREKIEVKFQERRQALFEELEKATKSKDFALLHTPRGIALAPIIDGEVVTQEQYSKLDEKLSNEIEKRQAELQGELRQTIRRVQEVEEEAKEAIRQLDQEVVGFAVEHLVNKIVEKYADLEVVVRFLENVRNDILKNVDTFKQAKEREEAQQQLPFLNLQSDKSSNFDGYRVNLLVDHSDTRGAPVVFESSPTYPNLLGRIEHQARFGALLTNFRMIKSGALHRANGGYLIVEARDILSKPMAWEGLKRALRDREIRIESMYESLGAISTRNLDPEPIPLDIKVVLIGDPLIYYMLYNLDEDLRELFKVKADFSVQMDWTEEALHLYARFIGTVCRQEKLLAFAPSGVAQIIEESARMVSHQKKLATKFRDIVDLIRQSSYWAGKNGHELVQDADVLQAVEEQIYRSNQSEEYIQEMIDEGTILIDTDGKTVGQVNGISVLPLGDYSFGKPSRITARTHVGKAGVVNIDREIELGGRIHNKGVMILTGYLGEKFAQEIPLTFSSSITFEQIYEEVEGDSASSAELYTLLSSLSGYPIRQDLAVTGSVNQRGQVQAIGGVNEKIEGFFEVCKLKGLTGKQGVVIPESNIKNLMLREDVVQAVKDGKFHVYPVSTIDEGIELLTGVEAGQKNAEGQYPRDTVNFAVQARLRELAERVQAFSNHNKAEKEELAFEA